MRFRSRKLHSLGPSLLATVLVAGALAAGPAAGSEEAGPGTWSRLTNPAGPDPRFGHSMVSAPEFGLVIMFGGLTTHGTGSTAHGVGSGDLWMIRPDDPEPEWFTPMFPPGAPAPGPRQAVSVAWDPDRHQLLVFGGNAADYDVGFARDGYNDLWALRFDDQGTPTGWVRLWAGDPEVHAYGVNEPVERWGAAAVYDSKRQRLIIRGGINRQSNSYDSVVALSRCPVVDCLPENPVHQRAGGGLPDMWAYDLAGDGGWTLLDPGGPLLNADSPKQGLAVYDADHDRMVTVRLAPYQGPLGCYNEPSDAPRGADIRSFDFSTNEWTDWPDVPMEVAPGTQFFGPWGYSTSRNSIVALAWEAMSWPTYRITPFALHIDQPGGAGTRWERLPGSPTDPAWQGCKSAADDPVGIGASGTMFVHGEGGERLVAFGGSMGSTNVFYGPTVLLSDDWETGSWSEWSSSTLLPRYKHALVMDESRRHLYAIGGHSAGVLPWEAEALWRLDLDAGRWEAVSPEGEAPPESHLDYVSAMAVYDPIGDRILQVPHYIEDDGTPACGGDTYQLDLAELEWSRLPTHGEAPRVCDASLIYDSSRHRLVLLNGWENDSSRSREVHVLDLGTETPAWSTLQIGGTQQGVLEYRGTRAVYDSIGDRALLLTYTEGPANGYDPQGKALIESLSFDGADRGTWSVLAEGAEPGLTGAQGSGMTPRSVAQMVFQQERNRLVIFGGRTEFANNPGDPTTYTLDLEGEPTWGILDTPGEVPVGRVDGAAAYDAQFQRMIVFGGLYRSQNNPTRETYALDLS